VLCHDSVDDVTAALSDLISFQPHLPRLEGAVGGEVAALNTSTSVDNFRRSVDLVLCWKTSINIFAFSSGTNFKLRNGAAVEDVVTLSVLLL